MITTRSTDRLFLWLLLAQWAFAILLAWFISPFAWEGKVRAIHLHLQIAVFFGGLLNALPVALILTRPGWIGTRYTIAIAQMLWSRCAHPPHRRTHRDPLSRVRLARVSRVLSRLACADCPPR